MKWFATILSILLVNCSPYLLPTENESDNTIQVRVECKNESLVVQQVIQALRQVRFNDLEKDSSGILFFVRARYQQLSDERAEEMMLYIKRIPGVMDVLLFRDGLPVKNILYQQP